jgi:hypothetical protein
MKNILGERFHEVIEQMYWENGKIIIICKSNLWKGKTKIIIGNMIDKDGLVQLKISTEEIE